MKRGQRRKKKKGKNSLGGAATQLSQNGLHRYQFRVGKREAKNSPKKRSNLESWSELHSLLSLIKCRAAGVVSYCAFVVCSAFVALCVLGSQNKILDTTKNYSKTKWSNRQFVGVLCVHACGCRLLRRHNSENNTFCPLCLFAFHPQTNTRMHSGIRPIQTPRLYSTFGTWTSLSRWGMRLSHFDFFFETAFDNDVERQLSASTSPSEAAHGTACLRSGSPDHSLALSPTLRTRPTLPPRRESSSRTSSISRSTLPRLPPRGALVPGHSAARLPLAYLPPL